MNNCYFNRICELTGISYSVRLRIGQSDSNGLLAFHGIAKCETFIDPIAAVVVVVGG